MPRNDGHDHAYHKLHCLYPVRAKRKGQADAVSPSLCPMNKSWRHNSAPDGPRIPRNFIVIGHEEHSLLVLSSV
jgi:hypothetical protein